jgi:hypothetical protein
MCSFNVQAAWQSCFWHCAAVLRQQTVGIGSDPWASLLLNAAAASLLVIPSLVQSMAAAVGRDCCVASSAHNMLVLGVLFLQDTMLLLVSSLLLFRQITLLLLLQVMGKSKVLVKVHPEGKYVVDIDKEIDIAELTPGEESHSHINKNQRVCVKS